MANKVILHGRLAADAVVRATRAGDDVANLRVITTSSSPVIKAHSIDFRSYFWR